MDNERIAIRGTVTRDPELQTTNKGKIFTRVSLAADEVTIGDRALNIKEVQENKYHSVVYWGVAALDKVAEVKQGARVAVVGDHVVRQAEGRDGQMRVFSEIHHGALTIEKGPREKIQGVPVEMNGEVLYDPELRVVPGSPGKFYTVITVQPENGSDRVRTPFFGEDAVELARAIRKGSQVSIKGEMIEREFTNREGVQSKGLEIQKASIRVLSKDRGVEQPNGEVARGEEQGLGG
jgi:single-stranded DNA-binding protein